MLIIDRNYEKTHICIFNIRRKLGYDTISLNVCLLFINK